MWLADTRKWLASLSQVSRRWLANDIIDSPEQSKMWSLGWATGCEYKELVFPLELGSRRLRSTSSRIDEKFLKFFIYIQATWRKSRKYLNCTQILLSDSQMLKLLAKISNYSQISWITRKISQITRKYPKLLASDSQATRKWLANFPVPVIAAILPLRENLTVWVGMWFMWKR